MTFLALVFTFLAGAGYVVLNVWVVRYARARVPQAFAETKRASRKRLAGFSNRRMRAYAGMHALGFGTISLLIRYPHGPAVAALIFFVYIVFACCLMFETLTFIRLRRPSAATKADRGWLAKVAWVAGTLLLTWIIRGVAKSWVGEFFGIEASSLPFTWAFATGLRALLPVFYVALPLMVILEMVSMAIAVSPPRTLPQTGDLVADTAAKDVASKRRWALLLMAFSSFFSMYALLVCVGKLAASPLAEMLLIDVAAEFDTDPAGVCKLGDAEAELAKRKTKEGRPDPAVRAVFSNTSQDKATLVRIPDHAFDDVDGRSIYTADVEPRKLKVLRTAECHVVSAPPDAAGANDAAAAKSGTTDGAASKASGGAAIGATGR